MNIMDIHSIIHSTLFSWRNDLFILFSIIITIIPKNTLKNIDSHDYFTSPFSMIIDNLLILSLPDY